MGSSSRRVANIYGPIGFVEVDDNGEVRVVLDIEGELFSKAHADRAIVACVNRTIEVHHGVPDLSGGFVSLQGACAIGLKRLSQILFFQSGGRLKMFGSAIS